MAGGWVSRINLIKPVKMMKEHEGALRTQPSDEKETFTLLTLKSHPL